MSDEVQTDDLFEAASPGKAFWDPGVYIGTLQDLRPGAGGQYGPNVEWEWFMAPYPGDPDDFILDQAGEKPADFKGWSSTLMTPGSKGRKWIEAHQRRPMRDGERVNKSEVLGQRVLITLTSKPKDDGSGMRSVIAALQPYDPSKVSRPVRTRNSPRPEERDDADLPF